MEGTCEVGTGSEWPTSGPDSEARSDPDSNPMVVLTVTQLITLRDGDVFPGSVCWHVNDKGDVTKFTSERSDETDELFAVRWIVGRVSGLYDPFKCFAKFERAQLESKRNREARRRVGEELLRETA